jgi:hypothetical protein
VFECAPEELFFYYYFQELYNLQGSHEVHTSQKQIGDQVCLPEFTNYVTL